MNIYVIDTFHSIYFKMTSKAKPCWTVKKNSYNKTNPRIKATRVITNALWPWCRCPNCNS